MSLFNSIGIQSNYPDAQQPKANPFKDIVPTPTELQVGCQQPLDDKGHTCWKPSIDRAVYMVRWEERTPEFKKGHLCQEHCISKMKKLEAMEWSGRIIWASTGTITPQYQLKEIFDKDIVIEEPPKLEPLPNENWTQETPKQLDRVEVIKSMYISSDRNDALDLMPDWLVKIFNYAGRDNQIVIAHYYIWSCDWYALEYDPKSKIFFWFASLNWNPWNDPDAEYGSFALEELQSIKVPCLIERETHSFTTWLTIDQIKEKKQTMFNKADALEPIDIKGSALEACVKQTEEILEHNIPGNWKVATAKPFTPTWDWSKKIGFQSEDPTADNVMQLRWVPSSHLLSKHWHLSTKEERLQILSILSECPYDLTNDLDVITEILSDAFNKPSVIVQLEEPIAYANQSPRDNETTQTVEARMDKLEANFNALMDMMTNVLKATKESKPTRSRTRKATTVADTDVTIETDNDKDVAINKEPYDCACWLYYKHDEEACHMCRTKSKMELNPLLPPYEYNEHWIVTNATEIVTVEVEKNFIKLTWWVLKNNKWLFWLDWSCWNEWWWYAPAVWEGEDHEEWLKKMYDDISSMLNKRSEWKQKTCTASKLLTKVNNHIAFASIVKMNRLNKVKDEIAIRPTATPIIAPEDLPFNSEENANLSKNIQKEIDLIRLLKQNLSPVEKEEENIIEVKLIEALPYEASIVYPVRDRAIDKSVRELANYKSKDGVLSIEDTYNSYSGKGGLHGIEFKECDSFHAYTEAKKEFELWQFFTPDWLCKQMVEVLQPEPKSKVCDLTCWVWRFFNYVKDCIKIGNEYDGESCRIAERLFPNATIFSRNIFTFSRYTNYCDYAVWNPPFNLTEDSDWFPSLVSWSGKVTSQDIFVAQNDKILKEWWGFIFIVPQTWLTSELLHWKINEYIDECFYRIWEFSLPLDTFREYEVEFPTKVVFLVKKVIWVTYPYAPLKMEWESFLKNLNYFDEYKWFIGLKKYILTQSSRINYKWRKEKAQLDDDDNRESQSIEKARFQIKQLHKEKWVYEEGLNLVISNFDSDIYKCRRAVKPTWMKPDEWAKKKPTIIKVISKHVNRLSKKYIKELYIRVTHDPVNIKFMASNTIVSRHMKLNDIDRTIEKSYLFMAYWNEKHPQESKIDLEQNLEKLSKPLITEPTLDHPNGRIIEVKYDFNPVKYINAKVKSIALDRADTREISNLYPEEYAKNFEALWELTFKDNKLWEISLLPHQQEDLASALIKNKVLLAWDTWLGKSLAWLVWCMHKGWRTLVVCPSVNVNDPWNKELKERFTNVSYFIVKNKKQVHLIKDEQFIVCSLEIMPLIYKQLRKLKFKNILLDESDNIKNKSSIRAKALKAIGKSVDNKIIMTGTPTRNNASEIYNQAEFLFNNWPSMLCTASTYIKYDRRAKEYREENNPLYLMPFPAYWWATNFQDSFCPKKLTVFWAEKTNQDIQNKEALNEFLIWFRYARLFDEEKPRINEILGIESWDFDWGYELNQHIIPMNEAETNVYKYILEVFAKEIEEYYKARHDGLVARMLTIVRQIFKLLEWVSHPWTIPAYVWPEETTKMTEAKKIFSQAQLDWRKVIFGSPWVPTIDHYAKYFWKLFTVFKLEQSMSKNKRTSIISEYKAHPWCAILMGTMALMKSGLNIPEATVVVTDSFSWNFAWYKQFIARAVRLNSLEKVQVHALMNEWSFDLNVFALMLKKERVNQFIRQWITTGDIDLMEDFDVNQEMFNQAMKMVKKKENGKVIANIEWGQSSIIN